MLKEVINALKNAGYKVLDDRVDEPLPGTVKVALKGITRRPSGIGRRLVGYTFLCYTKAYTPYDVEQLVADINKVLDEHFESSIAFEATVNNTEAVITFEVTQEESVV